MPHALLVPIREFVDISQTDILECFLVAMRAATPLSDCDNLPPACFCEAAAYAQVVGTGAGEPYATVAAAGRAKMVATASAAAATSGVCSRPELLHGDLIVVVMLVSGVHFRSA